MPRSRAISRSVYCERSVGCESCGGFLKAVCLIVRVRFPGDED